MLSLVLAFAAVLAAAALGLLAWARTAPAGSPASSRLFSLAFGVFIAAGSAAIYAHLGSFTSWQEQRVDENADWLLAARITEARREARLSPGRPEAKIRLAQSLMDGGQYREALQALEEGARESGGSPEILGLMAFAMYYRDGRRITKETAAVISRALAMDPVEAQSRMLLGQDAYLNGRYPEAVSHWKRLLDSHTVPERERALRNAIANAESRMARKAN